MEEKIDIAKLLKDCPSGMELDCTMFDNLYFDSIVANDNIYPIKCYTLCDNVRNSISLTKFGTWNPIKNAKCVITPKGETTWRGFVPHNKFKDGDILISEIGKPFILKGIHNNEICGCYCGLDQCGDFATEHCYWTGFKNLRLASKKEKEKLFQVIKEHGYHWNKETKTLEKLIVPKFKEGDKIRHKVTGSVYKIMSILLNEDSGGIYKVAPTNEIGQSSIDIEVQDNYESVSDDIKPKFKVRLEDKEIKQVLNDLAQYLNDNYGDDVGHPKGVVEYSHVKTTPVFTCWDCGAIVSIEGRIYFINDDDGHWWVEESFIRDGNRKRKFCKRFRKIGFRTLEKC